MPKRKPLPPELAVKLFDADPRQIAVTLADLLKCFRFDELAPDLLSGKLVATREPGIGVKRLKDSDIWFTGEALINWLDLRPDLCREDWLQ